MSIHHELTMRCNLSCSMCYQGEAREEADFRSELNGDAVRELYDRAGAKRVVLVGSEVLLHPDFHALCAHLDRRGTELHLITNGTLLSDDCVSRLLSLRHLESIIVSIDGPEAVHDAIRGAGAFARTQAGLQRLRGHVDVGLHCVLQRANLACADAVLDIAHALGITSVHYGFHYAYDADEVARTYELLHDSLGWSRSEVDLVVHEADSLGFDRDALNAALERIERRAGQLGLTPAYGPPDWRHHTDAYLAGSLHETHRLVCRDMLNAEDLRVDAMGRVVPCAVIHKELGDLRREDALDIANSDDRKAFAQLLQDENLLPVCRRCCRAAVLHPLEEEA